MRPGHRLNRQPHPIEANYIAVTRRVVTAQRLGEKAKQDEIDAKRKAASLMHAAPVQSFDFDYHGEQMHAMLARPIATRVNVRKLYTLLGNGEITLDQFFDCITASDKAVIETLGQEEYDRVSETYEKGLDLIIT